MTIFLCKASLLAALLQAGLVGDLDLKPRNGLERMILSDASWSEVADELASAGGADRQGSELIAAGFSDRGVQGKCHWFAYSRVIESNGLKRFGSACISAEKPVVILGKGFPDQAVAPTPGTAAPSVPDPPQQ